MHETLVVSKRGQVTLPAVLRKRMGIVAGGVLIAEERQGNIILRPAAVMEIDTYTENDISQWIAEDHLEVADRKALLERFRDRA
ncbi:AbrB/MazE/SpoVT family DNA-binding domain-containing protein [Desulfonatronum thiodismutans]|uniref:AbrB/MazE/SpoVT family DNA-binding domain-containing protein n=1 Tax=Desulfonatronum thiodismutans TaxID=159290 RepID=UPI000559370F|nr:AbrB/MazE/SpoVT family DNA-binding domain-containing protein [Desulfonatronum thiodismutans]